PTITLASPNGGESWPAGTAQAVTWTSTDPAGYVLVELDRAGSFHSYLGYALMADGQLDWDICPYIGDAADYTIQLIATGPCGEPVEDAGDGPFTISGSLPPPPTPTVTVASPNGGENWTAGTMQTVTWSSTNPLGDVSIDLYQGGAFVGTLGTAAMSAGSFTWNVCPSLGDAADYMIAVVGADACGESVQDFSDASFTVSGSQPTPALTITSPAGGETWSAFTTQTLTWSATDPSGTCYAYLLTFIGPNLQDVELIGSAPMSGGQLAWSIDQCHGRLAGATYEILMTYGCEQSPLAAASAAFDITPVGIFGDLNDDCLVDADDVDILAGCASGPAVAHDGTPQCQIADIDFDQDVDDADFAILQRCLGTAAAPVDPSCIQ
ncbi:MAG: hypothetical protein HY718_05495, partial [Planctomycetes bacterium]|nr:hypothetical protein [Planctomycetota bacterium]